MTDQPPQLQERPGKQSAVVRPASKPRSRAPLAIGLAFLIGVLAFFLTFQLISAFRRGPAESFISMKDRSKSASALAVPVLNAAFTGPGDTWKLSDQQGKVVLLNLFATWCGPCREEMPDLFALSKKYATRGVVFVALSLDHDNDTPGAPRLTALRDFVQQEHPPFPILLPSEQSPLMTNQMPVPQTLLFDKHGRRAQLITGKIDPTSVDASIYKLLSED